MDITTTLAQEFGLKQEYSQNIINLIDEGCTIPFIARYRKEMHGTCDDQTLRSFADRLKYLRNLNDEKAKVEKAITEQGKWTDELKVALENAKTLTEVEVFIDHISQNVKQERQSLLLRDLKDLQIFFRCNRKITR